MALATSWAAATQKVTDVSLDSTSFFTYDGIWPAGTQTKWLNIVTRTTTTAKAMTEAACIEQKLVIVGTIGSETDDTNTTCRYFLADEVTNAYTFEQTVTVTTRALADP